MANPEDVLRDVGGSTDRQLSPRDFLDVAAWVERDIPPADRLLGDLVTTTTRTFLVGRTGLGKTLFALGIACGIASGRGFLHWHCHRAGRVLVVDGEMPDELIKARAIDALKHLGATIPAGNLTIYARDIEDEFARRFPNVGTMQPLNTEQGQDWFLRLLDALGPIDLVIFDNVMSLAPGDQKDEATWSDVLPLVQKLTARRIGQIWCDHTGHNQDRQYGTSTKAWRFDAVGIMTPLPDDQRAEHEVGFTLSFDHPGKARRRTPDNWQDFAVVTVRLDADGWSSELAENSKRSTAKLSPTGTDFYRSLMDALAVTDTPGSTTRSAWYLECARVGLADAIEPDDDSLTRGRKQTKFRKYMAEIRTAGLIKVDGQTVTNLRHEK